MFGYYIHCNKKRNGTIVFQGVQNKIKSQIDELNKYGNVNELILYNEDSDNILHKMYKRLPWGVYGNSWLEIFKKIKTPSFIYIRKPLLDKDSHKFFRDIKKYNRSCRIIVELPTYPYDKELFHGLYDLPLFAKEKLYRNMLHKYIDRIVTYSTDTKIFDVPTIRIQNGIDVNLYPVVHTQDKREDINLIAVAALQPYHGYERIINGLKKYYSTEQSRIVRFLVVGEGEEQPILQSLASSYCLGDRVIFYGKKNGNDLTEIFNKASIGMGSFGFYKIGLDRASSLKTREYLARGLPVISGCRQDIFEIAPCDYHLEFPNDDSTVDIQKIVEFHDSLFAGKSKAEVFHEIRTYAEENVTMEKAFAPVIEYLVENVTEKGRDNDEE